MAAKEKWSSGDVPAARRLLAVSPMAAMTTTAGFKVVATAATPSASSSEAVAAEMRKANRKKNAFNVSILSSSVRSTLRTSLFSLSKSTK